MTLAGDRREVIFVGGTRFSGADLVAGLLAEHPAAARVPPEVRFHSDPWGVPALLHGRIGLDDFSDRLRAHEIAQMVPRERLDGALAVLRDGYHADPLQACRELFWALIGEVTDDAGDGALVEASPGNLAEAQTLTRLARRARFVHVVRDGRDVAAAAIESDLRMQRMPAGMEWWAAELREIERGVRGEEDGTPYAIPPERLVVVALDDLSDDADGAYRHLVSRLWLEEDAPVSPAPELDAETIRRGRWRDHARGPSRWWTTRRYVRTLEELERAGNHAAPALRAAYERLG